jgi:hypothetical protein
MSFSAFRVRTSLAGLLVALGVLTGLPGGTVSGRLSAQDAKTGTLKGSIVLDGAVPDLKPVVKMGDAAVKDAAICAVETIPDESLIVDKDTKGIANVFIYLAKAPEGYKYVQPAKPVEFDQKACKFIPHAMIVPLRTKKVGGKEEPDVAVTVLSADNCLHNTHCTTTTYQFNEAIKPMDRVGLSIPYPKTFRTPVPVTCDLHPWMKAYHLVVDHPFAAITDAKGNFEIPNLPAGKYEFVIFQESSGYIERSKAVEIKAGADTKLDLKVPVAKFKK